MYLNFETFLAKFIYLIDNTGIAVNPALNAGIVPYFISTAFEFWNVPNSKIYFNNALISDSIKN